MDISVLQCLLNEAKRQMGLLMVPGDGKPASFDATVRSPRDMGIEYRIDLSNFIRRAEGMKFASTSVRRT
jgi:hypothetical protein